MGLKDRLWDMLPSEMQGALKWFFGLFGNRYIMLILLVWFVTSLILLTQDVVFIIKHEVTQEKVFEKNVQYLEATKRLRDINERIRSRDSAEFSERVGPKLDTIWRMRFEQREREIIDSIKRDSVR